MAASEEQAAYIQNEDLSCDTKLLATAGSGKTFSIIQHLLHNITKTLKFSAKNIAILTFSKNAREDFVLKLTKKNLIDIIPKSCVYTIDSFAWKALGEEAKNIDVSILSYSFYKLLDACTSENVYHKFPMLSDIQRVYVDEAQDLNETQYLILMQLKQKCGCTLHLIGDPNQNIYQFRKASDRYLVDFVAKTFYLTKNYRSKGHIVEFCSHLRPYNDVDITYETPTNGDLKVMFYAYDSHINFEHYLLAIIHTFMARKIPLHKCAILSPTRGYIREYNGVSRYKGLCYISNLLYHHKIPFQQFYNDDCYNSFSDVNDNVASLDSALRIKYKPTRGHINLMTFTASKGLEWDYVIIVDANAHLISRKNYDLDKYNAEKYLLYVACSRPCKNLIVFTRRKYANPWFKDVPKEKYCIAKMCSHNFDFADSKKLFDDVNDPIDHGVSTDLNLHSLIAGLYEKDLFTIHEMIGPKIQKHTRQLIHLHNPFACKSKSSLVGNFLRHAFFVYATQSIHSKSMIVNDVQNALSKQNLIPCNNDAIIQWYFSCRDTMTWESWEKEKQKYSRTIVNFVDNHMSKDKPFNAFTLVNKFYECFIGANIGTIRKTFDGYKNNPGNLELMLYLVLASYAIQTTHYFYLEQFESFKKHILTPENIRFMSQLEQVVHKYYSHDMDSICTPCAATFNDIKIKTNIDVISRDNKVTILKTTPSITFKEVLKGLLSVVLHCNIDVNDQNQFVFSVFDISSCCVYDYSTSKVDVPKLIEALIVK